MELKEGWLDRQRLYAKKEIAAWSPTKREVMLCRNESHDWENVESGLPRRVQQCKNCEKIRIKFVWAADWTYVLRGFSIPQKEV